MRQVDKDNLSTMCQRPISSNPRVSINSLNPFSQINGWVGGHVVVVQSLSHILFFVTPWIVAHQAPLSCTVSQSLLKFIPIELVMLSNNFKRILAWHNCDLHLKVVLSVTHAPFPQLVYWIFPTFRRVTLWLWYISKHNLNRFFDFLLFHSFM